MPSKSKRAILEAAWVLRKQGFSLAEAADRALREAGYRGGSKNAQNAPPLQLREGRMEQQTGSKSRADVLFNGPDDIERAMQSVFQEREAELANVGVTASERSTEQKALTVDVVRSGLPAQFGRHVYGLYADERVSIARGTAQDEGTVERRERQLAETSRQEVARIYGQSEAEELLARVKKYVQQFPALQDVLTTEAIGSRADVVLPLVEHVRRINFR